MYRIPHFWSGTIGSNIIVLVHPILDKVRFPAQFDNSYFLASTPSIVDTDLIIRKGAVQIATLRFPAGNPIGVISGMPNPVFFDTVPEAFSIIGPAVADAALADVLFGFYGELHV